MINVFDFFSGCGGSSLGFQNLGFKIIGALDSDRDSANTFQHNFPKSDFINADIRKVKPEDLSDTIKKAGKGPLLFCGCAPCQPFSNQRKISPIIDKRKTLLSEFQRFVVFWKPDYIFLENVPGLQRIGSSCDVFKKFTNKLSRLKYNFDTAIVQASSLGVPQKRKRFILIASAENYKISSLQSIIDRYSGFFPKTRDFIHDLPPIIAGETHPNCKSSK